MRFRLFSDGLQETGIRQRQVPSGFRLAWVALLFSLAASGSSYAQIKMSITLDQQAYVVGEAFAARLLIENNLNTPMVFDEKYHNAELFVELVRDGAGTPPEADRRPVLRESVIMSGEKTLELIEITSLFDVRQSGGYQLRAVIRYEGKLLLSRPVGFDLVSGVEVLSVRHGLPGYFDVELEYSLRYWKRGGGEHAFFIIRDVNTDIIYGTFALGPIVRVNEPAIEFDRQGRVVVVHQSGRNRFTRSVLEADRNGAVLEEQTQHLADGSPYPQKKDQH